MPFHGDLHLREFQYHLEGGFGQPQHLFSRYAADGLYIPTFDPIATLMWQEDSQTTVTDAAGETIGFVTDSGPTGTSIDQATAGSRGTLQQVSGRFVWRGDGTADHLITDLTPASSTTIIVAFEANAASDIVLGANAASFADACWMGTDVNGVLRAGVGNNDHSSSSGDIRDVPGVGAIRFDGTTVSAFWKPLSGSFSQVLSTGQGGSPTSNALYIGGTNNNGSIAAVHDGDDYSVFVIKAAVTVSEVTSIAHYQSH